MDNFCFSFWLPCFHQLNINYCSIGDSIISINLSPFIDSSAKMTIILFSNIFFLKKPQPCVKSNFSYLTIPVQIWIFNLRKKNTKLSYLKEWFWDMSLHWYINSKVSHSFSLWFYFFLKISFSHSFHLLKYITEVN